MTSRRNTIQKDLVRNAVYEMKRHVTANEVYEFIKEEYPTIGKGTVYRNLDILVEEGALRKVEVTNGPNRFDFTLKNHYHVRCIKCGEIFDVDMDQIPDLYTHIKKYRRTYRQLHGLRLCTPAVFRRYGGKCNQSG